MLLDSSLPTDVRLRFALAQPDAVDVFVGHLETNEGLQKICTSGGQIRSWNDVL